MSRYGSLAVAVTFIVLSSVGMRPAGSIYIGQWEDIAGGLFVMEFFEDQTVRMVDVKNDVFLSGVWSESEKERIELKYTQDRQTHTVTGVYERGRLIVTINSKPYVLSRLPIPRHATAPENSDEREARLRETCSKYLGQFGHALKFYANESPGERFPPLSSERGTFMFKPQTLHPKYLVNTDFLYCPVCKETSPPRGTINSDCYWYLGYTLPDETTAMAFLKAFEALTDLDNLPDRLPTDSELPNGSNEILVLRKGVQRYLFTDINDPRESARLQSTIPVMIERPESHGNGGHVLYLDGHVEYIEYPGKFPMTKEFIEGLRRIETAAN